MRWLYYEKMTIQFRDIKEAWGIRQCNCLCSMVGLYIPIFKCYDKHNYYAYCRVSCPRVLELQIKWCWLNLEICTSNSLRYFTFTLFIYCCQYFCEFGLQMGYQRYLTRYQDEYPTLHAVTVCVKETYDFTVMIVLACQWLHLTSHFQSTRFGKWLSQWASGMMHYGKDKSSAKIMPSVPLTRKESLG
jgi:hypothetical protein